MRQRRSFDLINKAIEHGISLLGISDHNYGIGERKAEYLKKVRDLAAQYKSKIRILCGIAHTDLFNYCDACGYDYLTFFSKMAENNIFWEMNVSYDSIHKYKEHQYVLDFINDKGKLEIVRTMLRTFLQLF